MRINENTLCCAYAELDDIGESTPTENMKSFCVQQLSKGGSRFHGTTPYDKQLYSFYIFSLPDYSNGKKKTAGDRFADFIENNDLGTVYRSPSRNNAAFHPDHNNKMYVWMPNLLGIKEWWKINKGPKLTRDEMLKSLQKEMSKTRSPLINLEDQEILPVPEDEDYEDPYVADCDCMACRRDRGEIE